MGRGARVRPSQHGIENGRKPATIPTEPSLLSYVRSEENPPLTPMPTTADESAANRNKGREGELPQRPAQQRLRQKKVPPDGCSTCPLSTRKHRPTRIEFCSLTSATAQFWLFGYQQQEAPKDPQSCYHRPASSPTFRSSSQTLIFAISHSSSDQEASAQQRQSRGNGSQATPSEQLQPLPNLDRPVTPTMSCRASLFALHRLLLLLTCPVPRTHPDKAWMATADQAQASAPAYDVRTTAWHSTPT